VQREWRRLQRSATICSSHLRVPPCCHPPTIHPPYHRFQESHTQQLGHPYERASEPVRGAARRCGFRSFWQIFPLVCLLAGGREQKCYQAVKRAGETKSGSATQRGEKTCCHAVLISPTSAWLSLDNQHDTKHAKDRERETDVGGRPLLGHRRGCVVFGDTSACRCSCPISLIEQDDEMERLHRRAHVETIATLSIPHPTTSASVYFWMGMRIWGPLALGEGEERGPHCLPVHLPACLSAWPLRSFCTILIELMYYGGVSACLPA